MDISSMLEVQVNEVKETDSKENVTPRELIPTPTIVYPPFSQEECSFYKHMFGNDISSVRFRKLHCTACDAHIGSAPAESHNMFEHPVLHTLLCAKCREFYGDGTFEQGDDATDMFCRWCANGGNLYCCSYCSNTFCYKCIKRNFDVVVRKKIEEDEKWKCFVCDPLDLYTARAICWALLQHVQILTRILQNDRRLSPEELEEKMNLDESKCCPRRKKRKRRRNGSNSEDDDETYKPESKSIKKKYKHRNSTLKPLQPRPSLSADTSSPMDGTISLRPYEQLANTPVAKRPESDMVSTTPTSQQDTTVQFNTDSKPMQLLHNQRLIQAVPTANLLQSVPPFKPLNSLVRVATPRTYQPRGLFPPQCRPPINMVTIPTKNCTVLNRSSVLPSPLQLGQQVQYAMLTPNIIDLDSDSDEPEVETDNSPVLHNVIVHQRSVPPDSTSTVAVPVALVSTDKNFSKKAIMQCQSLREMSPSANKRPCRSFNQTVFQHLQDLDTVIDNFKVNVHELWKNSVEKVSNKERVIETQLRIKKFYREIKNTILQMTCVNDRVVREFSVWKKAQKLEDLNEQVVRNSKIASKQNDYELSLDLICVNDSASDSENEEKMENIIDPSELIESTNVLEDILFFKSKNTSNKAVGDSSVILRHKCIQIDTVEFKDYEKSIDYSMLRKADYNSSVTGIPDNYQEQFILFIQNTNDNSTTMEISKEQDSSSETTSKVSCKSNNLKKKQSKATAETVNTSSEVEAKKDVSKSVDASLTT